MPESNRTNLMLENMEFHTSQVLYKEFSRINGGAPEEGLEDDSHFRLNQELLSSGYMWFKYTYPRFDLVEVKPAF